MSRKKLQFVKYNIFILFVTVFCLFHGQNAYGFVDFSKVEAMEDFDLLPQEKFEEQTSLIEATPYGNKHLAYRFRVPNNWKETLKAPDTEMQSRTFSSSVLGFMLRYNSPAKNNLRSSLSVEAVPLKYEMNLKDWLANYIVMQRYTPRRVNIISDYEIELLNVVTIQDVSYAIRSRFLINGMKIIIISYRVPARFYNDEKVMQTQVINSFVVQNPEILQIEKHRRHDFYGEVYFNYPESWRLSAKEARTVDRMKASVIHDGLAGSINGQIKINVISKLLETKFGDEVKAFMGKSIVDGYDLGEIINKVELEYHEDILFAAADAYKLNSQKATLRDYEYWVAVMQSDEYYVIVSMITKTRSDDFEIWARNAQTFRNLAGSIRQYNDIEW